MREEPELLNQPFAARQPSDTAGAVTRARQQAAVRLQQGARAAEPAVASRTRRRPRRRLTWAAAASDPPLSLDPDIQPSPAKLAEPSSLRWKTSTVQTIDHQTTNVDQRRETPGGPPLPPGAAGHRDALWLGFRARMPLGFVTVSRGVQDRIGRALSRWSADARG
jgi:hypothetical protein